MPKLPRARAAVPLLLAAVVLSALAASGSELRRDPIGSSAAVALGLGIGPVRADLLPHHASPAPLGAGVQGSSTVAGGSPASGAAAGGASGGSRSRSAASRPARKKLADTAQGLFRGIVQFTGTPQVNNPSVAGGVIMLDWSQVEPSPGSYDWSAIDSQLSEWAAAGKRAAIRITTYALDRSASPQWLYAMGVPQVAWPDGSVAPVFWDATFLAQWRAFVDALAARYNGDQRVLWFQEPIGVDGESKPDQAHDGVDPMAVWQEHGYTDSLWWNTIQQLVDIATGAFTSTQVAVSVDHSYLDNAGGYSETQVIDWLNQEGVWPQDDSLTSSSDYSASCWRSPHLAEQMEPVSRSGDSLAAELSTAIAGGATYVLVYGSDIADPDNQQALAQAASQANGDGLTSTRGDPTSAFS